MEMGPVWTGQVPENGSKTHSGPDLGTNANQEQTRIFNIRGQVAAAPPSAGQGLSAGARHAIVTFWSLNPARGPASSGVLSHPLRL